MVLLKHVYIRRNGCVLFQMSALGKSPLAGLAALGLGGLAPSNTGGLNPAG